MAPARPRRSLAVPVIVATVIAAPLTAGLLWASGHRPSGPAGQAPAASDQTPATGYRHACLA
jgi:hypothetical protein